MKLKEVMEALNLKLLTKDLSEDALYADVEGGYVSDLLSNAMGQGQAGMLWVTMQGHQNVASVASLIGFAGVIVAGFWVSTKISLIFGFAMSSFIMESL